jgi:hypothetical protein
MYCVTSPYKRKDGTQQRSYVCANVRNETGLCDQPKLDAAKIDAAVVAHLDRLFIDFDAWLEQLARGAADHRASLEAELAAQLKELAKRERQEAAVQRRLAEVLESDDPILRRGIEGTLNLVVAEKETHQQRVNELRQALAEPNEPPTDAMLDIYNVMARAVRGGGKDESVADLNDRLRAVFEEFRLDRVDVGVVGVLPILRRDFIDRYRESGRGSVMADYEHAIPTNNLPDASPTVLWATEPPPVKPLRVPAETGGNTQTSVHSEREQAYACERMGDGIAYELLRVRNRDGGETTVYLVRHPAASTRVTVLCFSEPTRLDHWCAATGRPEAIVAGFFLRDPHRPLGEVRIAGDVLPHEPVVAPWASARACVYVDGSVRLARRHELGADPPGDLVQAGPLLVHDGRSVSDGSDAEGFSSGAAQFDSDITVGRYPRCALGVGDGDLLAVCCDGRRSGIDAGLELGELARLMISFGAREAINLDGGGSATLVHRGHLLNRPYSTDDQPAPESRPVATALLFETA